jgi:hypothetical protein
MPPDNCPSASIFCACISCSSVTFAGGDFLGQLRVRGVQALRLHPRFALAQGVLGGAHAQQRAHGGTQYRRIDGCTR